MQEDINMAKIYLLQHSYEREEYDETKIVGIYSTRKKAQTTINRYKKITGFKDYPESCFYIDEYEVDLDYWKEGFIK